MKTAMAAQQPDGDNQSPIEVKMKSWIADNWKVAVHRARDRGVRDPEQMVLDALSSAAKAKTEDDFEKIIKRRLYYDPKSDYRKHRRERLIFVPLEGEHEEYCEDPSFSDRRHCHRRQSSRLMRDLPKADRRLIWLRIFKRLPYCKIARLPMFQRQNCKVGALKARVCRIFQRLRNQHKRNGRRHTL